MTLADIPPGTAGAMLNVRFDANGANMHYLEACMRAMIDGAASPLFLSSGAEDYFLSAYYFNEGGEPCQPCSCFFIIMVLELRGVTHRCLFIRADSDIDSCPLPRSFRTSKSSKHRTQGLHTTTARVSSRFTRPMTVTPSSSMTDLNSSLGAHAFVLSTSV